MDHHRARLNFTTFIDPYFLLMLVITRPHTAFVVRNYLALVRINAMAWPPHSPDLNPINYISGTFLRNV